MSYTDQPRVRGNDWPGLTPPALGEWTPSLPVTVVVPAHDAGRTLPFTLAALAAQTYPQDLLEVVVVDDGSRIPVDLPDRRPANTRVVRTEHSWGRAHACHTGALAAGGDVVHWLDADMLPHRDEVEAQMRWHHLVDHAVVLGHKLFVDVADEAGGLPDLDDTVSAVEEGRARDLFADRWTSEHDWVVEQIAKTDGLTANPTRSYLVHTGASASVRREVYDAAGGMDSLLKLGEDVELGYRLAQQGAVFVPDDDARSWHLGRTNLMQRQDEVNRYNRPFVTDRVPDLRHWRTKGRSYSVPWVQAVVEAEGQALEQVRHSVDALLTASFHDVEVVLVGPWGRLGDERRSAARRPGPGAPPGARGVRRRGTGAVRGGGSRDGLPGAVPPVAAHRLGPRAGGGGPAGPGDDEARPRTVVGAPDRRAGGPAGAHLGVHPGGPGARSRRGPRRRGGRGVGQLVVRRWRGGLHPRRGHGPRARPGAGALDHAPEAQGQGCGRPGPARRGDPGVGGAHRGQVCGREAEAVAAATADRRLTVRG